MKIEQTIQAVSYTEHTTLEVYFENLLAEMAEDGWYVQQISQSAGVCIILFQRTT